MFWYKHIIIVCLYINMVEVDVGAGVGDNIKWPTHQKLGDYTYVMMRLIQLNAIFLGLILLRCRVGRYLVNNWNTNYNFYTYMWPSLRKPSHSAHLVFREILFWNIEATKVLLCYVQVTLDLQCNYSSYLASVLWLL